MKEEDGNALLFSLVHSLPANLQELTYMVNENSAPVILECGLMKYIPLLLRDNFSSALALLHKIHQNNVPVDEFFFRRETAFFFAEKVYWTIKNIYYRPAESHELVSCKPESATGALITEYRDEDLQRIIELFTSFVREDKNTYILDILFDVGYFYLINCIDTREVWLFYNTVFHFKLGSSLLCPRSMAHEAPGDLQMENRYTCIKSGRQELVIEINRRQFDTEVVMNKRIVIRYRKFVSKYRRVEHVYRKIASEVQLRRLPMCNVSLNTLYDDCSAGPAEKEKPLHLLNYLGVGYLSEVRDLPAAVGYLNMLKSISNSPSKEMLFKTAYKPDVLKRFTSSNFELNGIDILYTANELHKEIEMDCVEAIYRMGEDTVRYLMRALEYAEHGPCSHDVCWLGSSLLYKVSHILKDTLQSNKEWLFFKISYLFLLRSSVLMLSEHTCSASIHIMDILETLCQKILTNLRRNPYNFARMLFSYKKSRKAKSSSTENTKEKCRDRKKSTGYSEDLLHGVDHAEGEQYFDISDDMDVPGEGNMAKLESSEDSIGDERKAKLKRIIDQRMRKEEVVTGDDEYHFRLGLRDGEDENKYNKPK